MLKLLPGNIDHESVLPEFGTNRRPRSKNSKFAFHVRKQETSQLEHTHIHDFIAQGSFTDAICHTLHNSTSFPWIVPLHFI